MCPAGVEFIASHPMAGRETSSVEHAAEAVSYTHLTAYNKDKVYAEMLHDKKAQGGQITVIKVPGLGCWRAETIPVEGLRTLLGMEA